MAQGLLPAYLIVGADQLKRETAVSRLKGRLDSALYDFNVDERTATSDLEPNDIAISLNTVPFGDSFRLVLLHEANKLPKAVSETIISYLANPNPGCVLCLDCEALAKNTRLYKAVAKVGKRAVVDCAPIKPRDLPAYVVKHAKALGYAIDTRAATELISRVGEDTTLLDRQVRTLGEICGAVGRISIQDVEAHVARTAEVKPWEFLDCVASGKTNRALELYRHMQNPSHLALLTLVTRRVRELICARALIDRGQTQSIAGELGRQEWQIRTLAQSARRFTPAGLQECLAACAQCERKIKAGADGETEFLKLIIAICS